MVQLYIWELLACHHKEAVQRLGRVEGGGGHGRGMHTDVGHGDLETIDGTVYHVDVTDGLDP